MASSAAPKTTVVKNGVPYTSTSPAKANALSGGGSSPVSSGNAGAPPARGAAGWIDPIRAPGDTKYTSKYGNPTAAQIQNDGGIDPSSAGALANAPQQAPQAPVSPTTAAPAPATPQGANSALAPVVTPAAASTPTQSKYATGLAAAQASGTPPPASSGAAASAVQNYMPPAAPDSSVVDNLFQADPQLKGIMDNVNQLLSSQKQVPSIMDDYKKLKKDSGLDKINSELIDAETVINGTEDDIRNEIQTAGGMGTESQVQAMSLARNKNLLKRYNQLVQMKTDATNQLNTMLQLTQQDRQMAQERINTALTANFQMANFRQTALQNTRQQQQFMIQQEGADGYYKSVSKDPRQLAIAEQILGVAPGGLKPIADAAAAEKARKANLEERQIRATESNAAATWANVRIAQQKLAQDGGQMTAAQIEKVRQGVESAGTVLGSIRSANKQIGTTTTGILGKIGRFFPGSYQNDLAENINNIKANLSIDSLNAMRAASPTGGALGSVTEGEEKLLADKVAALSLSQSPAQLKTNLQVVQDRYVSYLKSMGYGYDVNTGQVITP